MTNNETTTTERLAQPVEASRDQTVLLKRREDHPGMAELSIQRETISTRGSSVLTWMGGYADEVNKLYYEVWSVYSGSRFQDPAGNRLAFDSAIIRYNQLSEEEENFIEQVTLFTIERGKYEVL